MITQISLHGHDSELFSFLDEQLIQSLQNHPAANVPLWSFGTVRNDHLCSVPTWNNYPGCFAWTNVPDVYPRTGSKLRSYKSFVTGDPLVPVSALALVRYLFSQGYTCSLNDREWIRQPADRQLDRLNYIRGWFGKSPESPEWSEIKAEYCDWCIAAMDRVELVSADRVVLHGV